MQKNRRLNVNRAIALPLIILGVACIAVSAFYAASYLAILGVSFIFWGSILLYITPAKHVPLIFLTAQTTANTSNIQRLLTQHKIAQKAIYLPPKNLQDSESSLIFIPKKQNQTLPQLQETETAEILSDKQDSLFLTPPGSALTKLFEQKLGNSFTRIDLKDLQKNVSKLIEDLAIAENIEIQTQNNKITMEINGSIFNDDCQETQKYPLTHNTVGCLLSSSLACVLAKTTGKPIIIENEEHTGSKTIKIKYQTLEE